MRKFLKIIFLLFVFLQFALTVSAQEQIQSFDTQIIINKDGTINIEEKITYDFANLERHGIYREIPFLTKNKEGKRFKLELENFLVTDESGGKYQYKKTISNGKINLKIGDPDRTISGIKTYIINYKVSGALTYFSDHDELYWNATGNDWTVPILHSTSGVELPVGISQDQIKAICYTGPSGSSQQNCTADIKDNRVEILANQTLNSAEGLTLAVSFPKGIVAVLEPKPYITFWQTILGKIVAGLLALAFIFWYIIYPIWIPIKWLRQGRDPSTPLRQAQGRSGQVPGEVRAWFDPPKSKSGRPLTPEETGALVDERADMEDVSGMIISLAQKGYLKIVEKSKGNFSFIKMAPHFGSKELLTFEKDFLNELFATKDEFNLKKSKLYEAVEKVKTGIYEQLVSEGFFAKNPNKVRTFYSVIGVFALMTVNFALAFSSFLFGRHMPRKTVLGSETASVARSLRNFLSSQERQLAFQAKNQMFFEKLLPFAVAFGVEKIWAERFKDITMKPPDWYSGYGTTGFNSVVLTNSLNSSFTSVRSAATPVTSSTGHGSGFSGGSSGGGGGGGGGGSW